MDNVDRAQRVAAAMCRQGRWSVGMGRQFVDLAREGKVTLDYWEGIMDTDQVGWRMDGGCWEPIEHEDRVGAGGACECGESRMDYLVWDGACEVVTCTSCGAEYVPGVEA